jgi:hypothetical protein
MRQATTLSLPFAPLLMLLFLGSLPGLWAQQSVTVERQWARENDRARGGQEAPGIAPDCFEVQSRRTDAQVIFRDVITEPAGGNNSFGRQASLTEKPSYDVAYGAASNRSGRLTICVQPYVKRNGAVHRITSYTAEVQPEEELFAPRQKRGRQSTVLNAPGWHRVAVTETGMVKITPTFLSENNIGNGTVAMNDVRVVGNGQSMLDETVGTPRPVGLQEVALYRQDANGDGLFNGNDYILFYAKGPHRWRYDADQGVFKHRVNTYRDRNYYFLSVSNGAGALPAQQALVGNATQQVTSFDDYDYVEDEEVNLVGTGRNWFGDVFEFTLSYNYSFTFPNLITSEPINAFVDVLGRSVSGGTEMQVSVGGANLVNLPVNPINTGGTYPNYGKHASKRFNFTSNGPSFTLNLNYDNAANPSAVAWLDDIEVQVRRELRMAGPALYFRDTQSLGNGAVAAFQIEGASPDLQVWDVTDPNAVQAIDGNFSNGTYSFGANANTLREYVAFRGSNFSTPTYVEAVEPQNLHGMAVPEMLVITHPRFRAAADELARFHEAQDGLQVAVVNVQEVYNEYSSGGQDIVGLRDLAKDLYDRDANTFKYLLLFGDASYDYKDRLTGNDNYVPVWTSNFSLSLGGSYISDDFYGYLDDGEGGDLSGNFLDIGVGRIPSRSLSEAQAYVDKVKRYVAGPNRLGSWRNNILLVTDDVDEANFRPWFVPKSEDIEQKALNKSPAFNIKKIYAGAYQQESTTGGESYPEATREFYRSVQQGCLITNYIGHGGEIGLASEKLLTLEEVNGWTNKDALSLFLTITCEFTRFDDPKRVSAGEQLLHNPEGGAIGLFSTTRAVSVITGINVNEAIFDTVLARPGGVPQRFGDILKATKNDPFVYNDPSKNKFSLIGDPAIRLAIPQEKVRLLSVNQQPLNQAQNDTIKALEKVSLSGQVEAANGAPLSDFQGVLNLTVYDKPQDRQTLVNDGIGPPSKFTTQDNIIYKGKVGVENGQFEASFRVPLDIDYSFGRGKASFYVRNAEENLDGAGSYGELLVGGYDENAPQDEQGPEIQLYLNDASFVNGGVTGPDPSIYAELSDSAGINTVGNGIGHDLQAILDGNNEEPILLNQYYEADLDSYQSGAVRYPLFDLEPGEHTLQLKAFDIYNNPSVANTQFVVAEDQEIALRRVLNYPNPFTTYTEFQFEHNRAGQPLQVQVQIFTVSGKLVKTINTSLTPTGNRVTGIAWNGLDDYGDPIGKGVYVYRVKVRSTVDNSEASQYEKLVLLR